MHAGRLGIGLLLLAILPATAALTRAAEAGAQEAGAGDKAPLPALGTEHDPSVPTTEKVLGYSLGERMTDFTAMQTYMQALSRDPSRVFQRTYGKTHEGRPLRYLVISHPDNMARLEEIRTGSVRLSDPRGLTVTAANRIIRTNPVIVWLAYSVHGDEHSSTEAALATAYELASSSDERTLDILRDVVVIIDPVQNPDGRERFLTYERGVAGAEPRLDPMAVEHDQPWPGGRFNHYLFDLNRDWFFQTQPETRGKVDAYQEWMPQVYVDLHEMSSNGTYYFAPPAEPINRNIPDVIRKWWTVFGRANADAFDRAGFDYYTGESFDDYYPGYGDSWPTLHGSIGMTYEQASPRGLAIEKGDGTVLTLKEAVRHHLTASLTTIATAAANREALLRDYHGYRKDAITAGATGPVRAYLIPTTPPSTALKLGALLAGQGVEVLRSQEEFTARVSSYDGSPIHSSRFPAGTLIVDLAQPAGRLASALMEADSALDEHFVAEELERRRLKEDSGIYDVTSWSLPIVSGALTYWTKDLPRVRSERASAETLRTPNAMVQVGAAGATYAYLLKYESNASAKALISLLNLTDPRRLGLKLQIAGRPFRIGGEEFPAGSVILKTRGNPDSLDGIIRKEASTFGLTFYMVSSGLTDGGPDLGSSSVVSLKLPRVAVAYGDPVSPTCVGSICYLFEYVYGLPFTPVRPVSLSEADLSRYNVVILPDASDSPGYAEYLGAGGVRKLKAWVDGGGTLITLKRASLFAAGKEVGLTTMRRLFKPRARADGGASDPNGPVGAGSSDDTQTPDTVPGAILRVVIEPSRYLGFGYGREGAVMVNSNLVFSPSKEGSNVVTFSPKDKLRLSGFVWPESIDLLAGSAYLVEEPRGRGRVILFADDPNFRGYWESLNRMFLNSVVFAPRSAAMSRDGMATMRELMRRTRWWLFGIGIALLGIAGYAFLRPAAAGADSWLTASIDRAPIRTSIAATGTLQAVVTVQVGSQVTGRIQSLHADFNSIVRKGQVIARIDPATFDAALVRARADLDDARAGLATARAALTNQKANMEADRAALLDADRVYQRTQELAKEQIASARDLEASEAAEHEAAARVKQAAAQVESAEAAIEQAEARVKQAAAAVKLAEVNLDYTVITSPVDGVVVSRSVDVGQTVAASLQAPTLFIIANDLTRMQVVANVDEADIGHIGPEAKVAFTVDSFPGEFFYGSIDQIRLNPVVTQNVVTYSVIVDVSNPELKLRPGMTANTTFTVAETDNAVRLPNAALRFWPANVPRDREREMIAAAHAAPAHEEEAAEPPEGTTVSPARPGGAAPTGSDGEASPIASEAGVLRFPQIRKVRWRPRVIWLRGDGGKPEPRVVRVGITDGSYSEVNDADLKEGEAVITGSNLSADSQARPNNPFGGPFGSRPAAKGGSGGARRP